MTETSPPSPKTTAPKARRDQSTIQFPYGDLNDAVAVAKAIMNLGGVPCESDQLASALGQTPTSGNFRMKIATARTFGAIETIQGRYQLTDLGFALTDKNREKAARVEAFLKVPLYRRVYEEFRNKQLPPRPAPLEHAFIGFGVAPKQRERVRQAFDRSAQQAGFFDQGGRDRLIRPAIGASTASSGEDTVDSYSSDAEPDSAVGGNGTSGGGGRRPPGLHPFVQGLLDTLPEPDTVWAVEGRAKWLQAAANIFDLMYRGDGEIAVKAIEKDRATE